MSARSYVASLRGPREAAIFARDDPRPGLFELPMLVGHVGAEAPRGRRGLTRRQRAGDALTLDDLRWASFVESHPRALGYHPAPGPS